MSAVKTTSRLARLRNLAVVAMAAAGLAAATACIIQPQPLPPGDKPGSGDAGAPGTATGNPTPPVGSADAGTGGDLGDDDSGVRTSDGSAPDGASPSTDAGAPGDGGDASDTDAGLGDGGIILAPFDAAPFDASGRT